MLQYIRVILVFWSVVFFSQTPTENYIYTKTCLTADCVKKSETVQYFDGLGRAKQTIQVQFSPKGRDVVIPVEYDAFGRQTKDYLPIPQTGTQNGNIYADPLSNATHIYGNERIFSEKTLETSPLDRLLEQRQVGNDWQQKPIRFSYDANTMSDGVKRFSTVTTWQNGATHSELSLSGVYGEGQLYKTTTTDEDGNATTEFKNGLGQVLLIRKKLHQQNVDTYYVYNEYQQLAFVIPPLAVEQQSGNMAEHLNVLCYQYRYDGKGRMVEKKLPGKGWEYMVYDRQDRLVLTQDAHLRSSNNVFQSPGWLFTKYDQFGRVVYTGFFRNSSTRSQMQAALSNIRSANNESRSSSSFNFNGLAIYYTRDAFPKSSIIPLSVNYYDTYPTGAPAIASSILGQQILQASSTNGRSTKGLPLVSMVKNIENDQWTKTYSYYDTNGRVVSSFTANHLGGYTRTETELDFTGIALRTHTFHKRQQQDVETTIEERYEYDHQNRLLKHYHKVGNQAEELLTDNTYNELSQLTSKKVGNHLEHVDYVYNIRGWLTGINTDQQGNFKNGKLFNFKLNYHRPEPLGVASTPKYNGNISQTSWRTAGDYIRRNYAYQYDGLDRLLKGTYIATGTPSSDEKDFYNETLTYDLNGNITTLIRFSSPPHGNTPMKIDDLSYHYHGNQLTQITDHSANHLGYPFGNHSIDYDANGNMMSHLDKGISSIQYNFLNLPNIILGNRNVSYTYRADGVKVRKSYNNIVTDYLGGFQYENGILKFFPTAEGYYDFENNAYIYHYKDHLGNIRLSYKNSGVGAEIVEEHHYYPFGLRHEGYNFLQGDINYQYKYNGKELQTETGMYSMDWRYYMPDIGRFTVQDPLSALVPTNTPYRFAFNNPVYFSDPTGLLEEVEHCPTCPKTPEFEPYINDKNEVYVYNPLTNTANLKVTPIEEVVVNGNKSESNTTTYLGFINDGFGTTGDWLSKNNKGGTVGVWTTPLKNRNFDGIQYGRFNVKYYGNNWRGNQYVKVKGVGNILKKGSVVGQVTLGAIEIGEGVINDYNDYQIKGETNAKNTVIAAGSVAGGVAGGLVGAKAGATVGASIGVWFGVAGAAPGALIGALIGGAIGAWGGSEIGKVGVEYVYENNK